jgi:spermidine/putrescine transport system ATP-binding protein
MQIELKRIQTEVGITFVHVTHDQEEAMTMADTIAVMNAGLIEQMGDPTELYENPATTFAANFLGQSNLVAGRILERDASSMLLDVQGSKLVAPTARGGQAHNEVWVGVRPEKVFLAPADSETDDGSNLLRGAVVSDVSFVGVSTQYLAKMPWGQELMVFEQNTGARELFRPGDRVDLHWMPGHTFVLDATQDALAGVEQEDQL